MVRRIFFAALTLTILSPAAARAGGGAPDVDAHRAEVGVLYAGVNLEGFGYRF